MIIKRLKVKNWKNFKTIDVGLMERQFIVGPNASGKSNLLDIFRFLRDVAKTEGGGLQKALKDRGGVSKVRSFAARRDPEISIEIELAESVKQPTVWRYSLGIKQKQRGERLPYVSHEQVFYKGENVLTRPNSSDKDDENQLTQTHLEQISSNAKFRPIALFLQSIAYSHLVPQLLRYADKIQGRIIEDDPFGQGFLERISRTTVKKRELRLNKIEEALKIAVPQLQRLQFTKDEKSGMPHLQAMYQHWRPNAGFQLEDQFSDGTLRLIGLLWSLLDGESPLLLEEPELSLNSGIVMQLAPLIHRAQRQKKRQVIISTHSEALLSDEGIDGREVLMLIPEAEETKVLNAYDDEEIRGLLAQGFRISDVILPKIKPRKVDSVSQISLF